MKRMHTLSSIISHYMRIVMLVLIVAFLAIILYFQMENAQQQACQQAEETFHQIERVLRENSEELIDIKQVYRTTCQHNAEVIAYIIEDAPSVLESVDELKQIAEMVEVDEIHIFDATGCIFAGTHPEYYGFTFDSGEQIGFFKPLLNDKSLCLVQDITPNTAEKKMMQYSALWSKNGRYIVQIGMEPANVLKVTAKNELSHIFSMLRVNSEANYYAINKKSGEIVGSTDLDCVGKNSSEIALDLNVISVNQKGFHADIDDTESFCVFMEMDENYIGRVLPCRDLYRQIPLIMIEFAICLGIIVIIMFYVVTYCMNKFVVNDIRSINDKLRAISQGELNETVDVKNSIEFMELSSYINRMKKSIMENFRKMSYVISKTQMAIGVYEYSPDMKKVWLGENVPEILELEAEECERLCEDYKVFRKFINTLRQNAIESDSSVYHYREHYFKLDEIKTKNGVFGVVIDVTAEIEKRKVLESEREAKSRFLYNMSHEIRTPINAILGMNEMILREAKDKQILTYSSNVQSSGKMLLSLINDILDTSKIESGKMEIVPVEYMISNVIIDLWNIIYLHAKNKDLALNVEVDETLPSVLYGDDVRVKQIVTNLLTNAVKYTQEGSVWLKISYERQNDDGLLLKIAVLDTGIGIREEDMGKLFENFQRIDEEKNRNIEGTGLGMGITMSLLKMMDGDMKVESEYGKGSTFTVFIPQKIVSDEPTGSFQKIQEENTRQNGGKKGSFIAPEGCVLVVDDNEMNLTVFKSLLKRTKIQVVTAEAGKQCLEYVQKQKFHIIFMDHMMPEMDGIETLHEIQKLGEQTNFPNKDTPVIVLTANAVAGAREMYFAEGFVNFLTKPIDSELIEQTICRYLPEELIQAVEEADDDSEVENVTDEYDCYLEQGVSVRNGLQHSQNNIEIYIDLVRMFLKDKGKIELLREYLSGHNMKEYAIQVHALKGNARTIGADKLADIVYEHEMQSKAENEDYITAHWGELEQEWEHTMETMNEIYNKYAPKQEETDVLDNGELSELLQEELDETAELIDSFKTDAAVSQIKEWLKSSLPQDMRQRLTDALAAIEDEYDEDKAIEILKKH